MKIDLNDTSQKHEINLEEKRLEAGYFGKIFGTGPNASNNIAGIILIGLLLAIITSSLVGDGSGKFIETVVPIFTLALGYLFGKQS
jgi:hypothetical protein